MAASAQADSAIHDESSDFEYEYDANETETFLVDLDLSSLNGLMRSHFKRRRTLLTEASESKEKNAAPVEESPAPAPAEGGEGGPSGDAANGQGQDQMNGHSAETPQTDDPTPAQGNDIQILELHSHNPIISYENEIYSCTWSDMIGTNMFFAEHDEDPETEPLRSTEAYDLLGTSRIKLVGQKAKVIYKAGKKRKTRDAVDSLRAEDDIQDVENEVITGKSLGNLRYSNAKVNADIKKQARFLEKFMDVKRAKGETDNVRTVLNRHLVRAQNHLAKKNPAQRHATLAKEIEQLNRRVVRGDADALARLQEIYSKDEDTLTEKLPPAPMAVFSQRQEVSILPAPEIERHAAAD